MKVFESIENKIKFTIPIKYHIIFWVVYFLFNSIRWGSYFDDYWYSVKSNMVEFPLHIIMVYLNIYYLIPKFIITKKYKSYLCLLALALICHYFVRIGLSYWLVSENVWREAQGVHQPFGFNHVVSVILGELYVIGLVSAIKFTFEYVVQLNKSNHLLTLQSETELKFLKAKIQPHFFFNTLNNLYALTLKRSKKAPEVVLKLSEIMEYVIYDINMKKTTLGKEIRYVKNYIELERIRHGYQLKSDIKTLGDLDDIKLPPLLFLPFVENCFKHGQLSDGTIKMEMTFEQEKDMLQFTLTNDFEPSNMVKTKEGIGIANTRRRLDLLYEDAYTLDTYPVENRYHVKLKIPLK
ncbi:sensor histidine kinase [Flagellimonas sp. W118]|uniref:sensor histidine kinase n=1 Tax=Flagellimonas sp. W118 TaxID=3410791 RepID=UPI003BF50EBC